MKIQVEVRMQLLLSKHSGSDKEQLGCLIAHFEVVGGNENVIEKAESLRKAMLDPVQFLEKAFEATPDGTCSDFAVKLLHER